MNSLVIEDLHTPEIISRISGLVTTGRLEVSGNNLVYLDVQDNYIHQLFPLLPDKSIKKPDYFGAGSVGAHISVIYPEEDIFVKNDDLNKEHAFAVQGAFAADICLKRYYFLMVNAPSLLLIRRKYNLPDRLPFKGYSVGFHITIGVQSCTDARSGRLL